jgi:hypothetical protein
MTIEDRKAQYSDVVKKQCEIVGVNYRLMMAIIEVESSWEPYAVRYEKDSSSAAQPEYLAKINGTTRETEMQLQKFSWGIGQILGATARNIGMRGPMPSLCNTEIGAFWSAMYLKKLCCRYPTLADQISAYNGGSSLKRSDGTYANAEYISKVNKVLKELPT